MQIVIDINDCEYDEIKRDAENFRNKGMVVPYLYKVITSGTPLPNIGHWEYVQYDGNPNIGNWHCSECRAIVNYEPTYKWEKKPYHKFCPNCGVKMEETE